MATSFDGDNLLITLDPVVSGVLTVDVQEDIYEPWKDWMKTGTNSKYVRAFRSDGGAALSDIINQGSYFFLNNIDGWRIKPAENDGTYFLVGNLAAEDTSLPAIVPTTGAYTTAIIGLQPVTQGVTSTMKEQLEFNTFQGAVCIDSGSGISGTGYHSSGNPIGIREYPVDNMADAIIIANNRGLNGFNFMADYTIVSDDLSSGFAITGDSPFITVTAQNAADLSNCSVENITIVGELDGLNTVVRSNVGAVTNVSGYLEKVAFSADVTINGQTMIAESYSQFPGSTYMKITTGTNTLMVRDYKGSIGIDGMTGGVHSVGIHEGRLIIENTCTGGTISVRGRPYDIVDNSGGLVTINDETESISEAATRKQVENKRVTDPSTGVETVYDDDGVTVLSQYDLYEDVAETTRYNGSNGINVRTPQ